MSRRRLVRLAAPAAFLLAATIAVLAVRQGLRAEDDGGTAPPVSRTRTTTIEPRTTTSRPPLRRRQTYTVQPGDTLDEIALEFDTTVERLLEANPEVEPAALRPGQRLRVP